MKACAIEGCENKYFCKGYCQMHYMRLFRYGNSLFTKKGRDQEKHGKRHTSEYMIWAGMKNRCYNENDPTYKYYGGRGITVCDRWRNSFMAFFEGMGQKPFPKAQIDRIDNDGNYTPENCRWVTAKTNCRNRSMTKLNIEKASEIRTLYENGGITQLELAAIYGVHYNTIYRVVRNKSCGGWVA